MSATKVTVGDAPSTSVDAPPVPGRPTHPHLRDIVARVALSVTVAVVAPAVLFATTLVVVHLTAAT